MLSFIKKIFTKETQAPIKTFEQHQEEQKQKRIFKETLEKELEAFVQNVRDEEYNRIIILPTAERNKNLSEFYKTDFYEFAAQKNPLDFASLKSQIEAL